ncbi:MAG: hypothetical protein R2881_09470 [Eubacteriales bacterium]
MSFVAVLPEALAGKRLKISLVYLHPSGTFTLWLTAGNRAIQRAYPTLQGAAGERPLTKLERASTRS